MSTSSKHNLQQYAYQNCRQNKRCKLYLCSSHALPALCSLSVTFIIIFFLRHIFFPNKTSFLRFLFPTLYVTIDKSQPPDTSRFLFCFFWQPHIRMQGSMFNQSTSALTDKLTEVLVKNRHPSPITPIFFLLPWKLKQADYKNKNWISVALAQNQYAIKIHFNELFNVEQKEQTSSTIGNILHSCLKPQETAAINWMKNGCYLIAC